MEKIKIVITCRNAAFQDDGGNAEAIRILQEIIRDLEDYAARDRDLLDINGNTTGHIELE